jgi:hypothetical protein
MINTSKKQDPYWLPNRLKSETGPKTRLMKALTTTN